MLLGWPRVDAVNCTDRIKPQLRQGVVLIADNFHLSTVNLHSSCGSKYREIGTCLTRYFRPVRLCGWVEIFAS